jgi:3-dehydroquinate synthase
VVLEAIQRAAKLKADVVSHDEKEQGQRIVLNFGHTIAHALENLLDYKDWLHGEAVALGMLVATDLSVQQGLLPQSALDRLVNLLTAAGLPLKFPKDIAITRILTKIKQDKKHRQQKLSWVLLKAVGQAYISEAVSLPEITIALKRYGAKA